VRLIVPVLFLAGVGFASAAEPKAKAPSALESGFLRPPDSARPHTWWHWMDGNITREGITLDLEAMKRVGVGGAQIFDVQPGVPPGPVRYAGEQWRAMIKHAASEADRLGLELCLHNCAGWSSSGGPWVKPEQAMQMLVVSEARAKGPGKFEASLPQPPARMNFYHDIVVLAFPTPPAERARVSDLAPRLTSSQDGFDGAKLIDGKPETAATLFLRGSKQPTYLQFEFAQPFTARALTMLSAGGRPGSRVELQVSDDGQAFRKLAEFGLQEPTILRPPLTLSFAPATGRFFRLVFPRAPGQSGSVSLAEVSLEPGFRIGNWPAQAGYLRADNPAPDTSGVPAEAVIDRARIIDLTAQMEATGKLTWDAPAGDWTILRFGYTVTGKDNHPAPESGRGLECDKLSAEAVDAHFAGNLAKVMTDLGPLAGRGLKHLLIDSYEVDSQNWTPRFREEFRKRRGYDPLPYLPVMATGRVVDGLDASERFLWDVRRTIADLFAENYYGHYAELCHQHGLKLSAEPYGNGNFDTLSSGGEADIPMTEFWAGWGNDMTGAKLASSIGHTYGRPIVGAESFTAAPENGRWTNTPYSMKALGDMIYCGGVNRFIFHRYAHQPWVDLKPGMTMGPWGIHFERTMTWWDESPAWLTYLARCQYLLQSGSFVADLCYFYGEGSPNDLPGRNGLSPVPPRGYDYDGCDAKVILTRMSVKEGHLTLRDGVSYRALVLRPDRTMTPALLRKLRDLVRDGATVVGPKPLRSPSLEAYPNADAEVQALADELWGPCDGKTVTEHACGRGRVVWGKPLEEVLAALKVGPDFQVLGDAAKTTVNAIHRRADGADIYFVADQNKRAEAVQCAFRVTGKAPELWHPDTGRIEPAPVYRVEGGRTIIPLRFDPAGSVFVVFRTPAGGNPIVAVERDGQSLFSPKRAASSAKLEVRKAVYGVFTVDLPEAVDVTTQLQKMVQDGRLTVQASNAIAGDPADNIVKQLRVDYTLDGKPATRTVEENQTLTLPDASRGEKGVVEVRRAIYGVLPDETAPPLGPRTVDVTDKLRGMVRDNALSVAATNDLAGDPTPLVVKELRVDYTLDGRPYSRTVGENDTLILPDGNEAGLAAAEGPPSELEIAKPGHPVLIAWEPGAYRATTASGKHLQAEVTALPPAVEIAGPWELRFPPNLGAPERATFDKLISWTESPESGIKYFSGTATYVRELTLPAKLFGLGNVLMLDLGAVKEIAEVRLNGKDLGLLWKPPFRVDITEVAKPGPNALEVRVTNLWPNRLIGDEQLPADCEWQPGGSLKAWPAWLVEGKPRPPTGRIAFTTWKHYTKDSPLLESGLLGPVTVRGGRRVPLAGG
jgi:hypothetical protein